MEVLEARGWPDTRSYQVKIVVQQIERISFSCVRHGMTAK